MPALENSHRRLHRATYAPIDLDDRPGSPDVKKRSLLARAIDKATFVRALSLSAQELERLEASIKALPDHEKRRRLEHAFGAVRTSSSTRARWTALQAASLFASIDAGALSELMALVAELRSREEAGAMKAVEQLLTHYRSTLAARSETSTERSPAATERPAAPLSAGAETVITRRTPATEETQPPRLVLPASRTLLDAALEHFEAHQPAILEPLNQMTTRLLPQLRAVTAAKDRVPELLVALAGSAEKARALAAGFDARMRVEPVGRLHLERLEMTPVALERGELVYTVPLAPKETVNIAHKEWSVKTQEFAELVNDAQEGFSEQGVAEKKDIASSSETQSKRSNAINVGSTVSSSFGPVSISASVGYNSTSNDERSKKESRGESVALTRRASSRARKEHQVSFKVSSVAGTEDLAVRTITNPSETSALRIDYFRLMRKWRIDLYRYDLRMTYDVVIPNPGADLMRRFEELRALDREIDEPFQFDVTLADVTVDTWATLGATYAAPVPEPPPLFTGAYAYKDFNIPKDQRKDEVFDSIELQIDPRYRIRFAGLDAQFDTEDGYTLDPDAGGELAFFDAFKQSQPTVIMRDPPGSASAAFSHRRFTSPRFGGWTYSTEIRAFDTEKVSIGFRYRGLVGGHVEVTAGLMLTPDAQNAWRFQVWKALESAALTAYQRNRQQLMDKRTKLAEELGKFDALTLRRKEHEEIMKAVLEWMLGPAFERPLEEISALFRPQAQLPGDPAPSDDAPLVTLDPTTLDLDQWRAVLEVGELAKYLHNAIEWENLLYFTYPYFWDSRQNWSRKLFFDHPDSFHRDFLRAGCARVVLTIRPGFEETFAKLMDSGELGSLQTGHPYVDIAGEIKHYAETNYPGIPPANPASSEDDDALVAARERGELIGRWYDYTPTSGLDIALTSALPEIA